MTRKRKSTPRLFFKTENLQEKEDHIKRLNAQGVGPLSIAVRLGVSAKLVLKLLEKNKEEKSYEPQSWGLNDQFL